MQSPRCAPLWPAVSRCPAGKCRRAVGAFAVFAAQCCVVQVQHSTGALQEPSLRCSVPCWATALCSPLTAATPSASLPVDKRCKSPGLLPCPVLYKPLRRIQDRGFLIMQQSFWSLFIAKCQIKTSDMRTSMCEVERHFLPEKKPRIFVIFSPWLVDCYFPLFFKWLWFVLFQPVSYWASLCT